MRRVAGMRHQPWWYGRFKYGVACSTPWWSCHRQGQVVEDDEATPRGNAEGVGSRTAVGVATALGGVAVGEAEMEWEPTYKEENHPVKHFETMSRSTTMTYCQGSMETSNIHGLRLRRGKPQKWESRKAMDVGKPSSRKTAGGHRRVPPDVGILEQWLSPTLLNARWELGSDMA